MMPTLPIAKLRPRGRSILLVLGLGTVLLFGGAGLLLITFVQGRDPWVLLMGPWSAGLQVLVGAAVGAGMGFAAWQLASSPGMQPVLDRYAERIGPLLSRRSDRIFLSLCAGVGEELFFRGALQHWLGVLLTALIFVAVHGYLDPRDRRMFLYGSVMTVMMAGLGWLAGYMGLLAPMAAHAVIDIVLFEGLHRAWRERASLPVQS